MTARKTTARKTSARKAKKKSAAGKATGKKATGKKSARKKVAKKASAKKAAAGRAAAKKKQTKKQTKKKQASAAAARGRSRKTAATAPARPLTASSPILAGDDRYLAQVIVFGGGIAGLTAAHELAERGFRVVLVEPKRVLDGFGRESIGLGGMARTQYLRVPFQAGARWWENEGDWPALPAREVGPETDHGCHVVVEEPDRPLPKKVRERLEKDVASLRELGEPRHNQGRACPILLVAAPLPGGFADAEARQRAARRRAEAVESFLVEELGVDPSLVNIYIATYQASIDAQREKVGNPPSDEPWVGLRLDQSILPGEHGFRFFPSYYRHMFDTMHRIPLPSDGGYGERTVYDNIRSARIEAMATRGHVPVITTRSAELSSAEKFQAFVLQMRSGEFDLHDIQQFMGRLLRYMCTGPGRRDQDFGEISWWQFIAAWDPKLGVELLRYSEEFERTVKFSGKVLAAFDADRGDAHTNGDTYIQLFLSTVYRNQTMAVDGTLNGPTSEALFAPWRSHLENLGVTFVPGALESIEFDVETNKVVPYVTWDPDAFGAGGSDGDRSVPVDADYYVVATDVVAAERLTGKLPAIGVPGGLRGYTTTLYPGPGAHRGAPVRYRDPITEPGLSSWDRLQTLAGLQFFFPSDFKLVFGHIYFTDAEWALSSINEPPFWRNRPTLNQTGYTGLLSVDIGSWRAHGSAGVDRRTAWQSSEQEIGREVWRQIRESLQAVELGKPRCGLAMPQPTWFHIDSNIRFDDGENAPPTANLAPFLVPMVGDWNHRPGTRPWVPTGPPLAPSISVPDVWQAAHGGYPVHWDQLVFAGTYLRTTTRMTTMESANESARHAVNAIIDHYVAAVGAEAFEASTLAGDTPADEAKDGDARHAAFLGGVQPEAQRVLGNSGAPVTSGTPGEQSPIFPTTWIGDYCQIWDPEQFEPPDLRPLRDLDQALFEAGLPHLFDVLGLEPAVHMARAAHVVGGPAARQATEAVRSALRAGTASGAGPSASGVDPLGVLEALKKQAEVQAAAAAQGVSAAGPSSHDPLDPLGLRDLLRHLTTEPGAPAGGGTNRRPGSDPFEGLLGLDPMAGIRGWEQFLDLVETLGGEAEDARQAQADVLRALEKVRRDLERELLGDDAP